MAKIRACRAPFTDARDGRLKSRVRQTFRFYDKPLTTTELVKHCYWSANFEGIKSWHRANVSRVANMLAIQVGRATSQGRPIIWSPRPELMQDQLGARQQKRNGNYRLGAPHQGDYRALALHQIAALTTNARRLQSYSPTASACPQQAGAALVAADWSANNGALLNLALWLE